MSEADLDSMTPKDVRTEVESRFGLEDGDLASFRKQIIEQIGVATDSWPENHFEYEEDGSDSSDGGDSGDSGSGGGHRGSKKRD